jgi:hypothetical protein
VAGKRHLGHRRRAGQVHHAEVGVLLLSGYDHLDQPGRAAELLNQHRKGGDFDESSPGCPIVVDVE